MIGFYGVNAIDGSPRSNDGVTTVDIVPVHNADAGFKATGWGLKPNPDASTGNITPGIDYAFKVNQVQNSAWSVLALEKYIGTNPNSALNDNGNSDKWQVVSLPDANNVLGGIKIDPDGWNVYRIVMIRKADMSKISFTNCVSGRSDADACDAALNGYGPNVSATAVANDFRLKATLSNIPAVSLTVGNKQTITDSDLYVVGQNSPKQGSLAGTYKLAEQSKRASRTGNKAEAWDDADQYYAPTYDEGYVCTDENALDSSGLNNSYHTGFGPLTVNAGRWVKCKVYNAGAAVSPLAWDQTSNQAIEDTAAHFNFTSTPTGLIQDDSNWPTRKSVPNNTGFFTPNANYTMAMAGTYGGNYPGKILLGYQTCTEKPAKWDAAFTADSCTWSKIQAAGTFVPKAGQRTIIRAVYMTPTSPDLPLTGGNAASTFYILGFGAIGLGALGAVARRRFAKH